MADHRDPSRQAYVRLALLAVWRSRLARLAAVAFVASGVALALAATLVYSRVVSETCQDVEIVDISIEDLIALKRRKEAYQIDPFNNELGLTGEEVSFLMRGNFEGGARVWFTDGLTEVRATVPREGGCYNLYFSGDLRVDAGTVNIQPEEMSVGDLDLTPWLAGRVYSLRPEDFEDPLLIEQLHNTTRIEVRGDQLFIEVHDPWRMPW